MSNFILKRTRVVLVVVVVAVLCSGGVLAMALMGQPLTLAMLGNVSEDIYIRPPIDIVWDDTESADDAIIEAATEAVSNAAVSLRTASGATLRTVAPPVTVSVEDENTAARLSLPQGYNTADMTTMAMLNEDGTLTPVPTRVDGYGNVLVLISGDVTLVPLNVEANFTDIDLGTQFEHVTEEINRAASMMIVQGRGNGRFVPDALVTGREAVTMILRAMGVPVEWATAMETAAVYGLIDEDTIAADDVISRIETAIMVSKALYSLGLNYDISPAYAVERLSGFSDIIYLSDDEMVALATTVDFGIFRDVGGGTLSPDQSLQRSAIASLVVRMQDVFLG